MHEINMSFRRLNNTLTTNMIDFFRWCYVNGIKLDEAEITTNIIDDFNNVWIHDNFPELEEKE